MEEMKTACMRMWRKYMTLDDKHCPLWSNCEAQTVSGHADEHHLWSKLPRIAGRS